MDSWKPDRNKEKPSHLDLSLVRQVQWTLHQKQTLDVIYRHSSSFNIFGYSCRGDKLLRKSNIIVDVTMLLSKYIRHANLSAFYISLNTIGYSGPKCPILLGPDCLKHPLSPTLTTHDYILRYHQPSPLVRIKITLADHTRKTVGYHLWLSSALNVILPDGS